MRTPRFTEEDKELLRVLAKKANAKIEKATPEQLELARTKSGKFSASTSNFKTKTDFNKYVNKISKVGYKRGEKSVPLVSGERVKRADVERLKIRADKYFDEQYKRRKEVFDTRQKEMKKDEILMIKPPKKEKFKTDRIKSKDAFKELLKEGFKIEKTDEKEKRMMDNYIKAVKRVFDEPELSKIISKISEYDSHSFYVKAAYNQKLSFQYLYRPEDKKRKANQIINELGSK